MSWRKVRLRGVSQVVLGILLSCGLALGGAVSIQAQPTVIDERKVIAVLTDWTGNFIGGAAQTERVREGTRARVGELLFPSSGDPSPIGFNAERDRLFIARFGLVTDRRGIQPLKDFLQIQLDLDIDLGSLDERRQKQRLARAFGRDPRQLETNRGTSGAEWGYPTVVWTIAVDRINRRAEELGLSFESIVLVLVSDDVPNLGKGLASEAPSCARLLRRYSRPDSDRFESFYDLYTKYLTTERISGVSIDPIPNVGEDGEGFVRAFRVAPGVVGVDLNRVFNVESQGFGIQADGQYRGDLKIGLDPSPLYPAAMAELKAELRDPTGGLAHDLGPVMPDTGGTSWNTLPASLGSGNRDARDYRLHVKGELVYPEIAELSRFRTAFTYPSPVKVEVEGLLKLADGRLLAAEMMQGDETPEAARRRIDGFKDIFSNFMWAGLALIAFVIAGLVFYRAVLVRPPLLRVTAVNSAAPTLDWRGGGKVPTAVPVGSLELTNLKHLGGVHREWTAKLEVTAVDCDRDLVFEPGTSLAELFSFAGDGSSQTLSDELAGKKGESVPLHLRTDRIVDLKAAGTPDHDGNFRAELTATVAIRAEHELDRETCTLTVPVVFAAPRPRWSVEWLDAERLDVGAGKTFLYNELCERPAVVRRLRIFHSADREALWPCEVRLAVLDPEEQAIEGLRLVVPDGLAGEAIEIEGIETEDGGSRIRVGRFGLRSAIEVAVEYSALALDPPKQLDTEIDLRIFDLTGDEPKMRGGPASFKVGLDVQEPHPLFRVEAIQQSKRVAVLDTSVKRPSENLIELDSIQPLLSGEELEDPWTFVAKLEFGNAAEKAHPKPVGEDGQMDPGTVSFEFGQLDVDADFESLGITREELVKCFRVVKKLDREKNSAEAKDFLALGAPFGFLEPGPNAWEPYQLELDQLGFEGLAVDTAELRLTLHFEGFVRDIRVEQFSQRFHLPLIADYGERWFLMDIGTSAIVAMSMNGNQDSPGFLELARSNTSAVRENGGQDPRLLPSTLFIEKDTADEDGYRLVFRDSPDEVEVSSAYRLLPAFKLLVGSQQLPLTKEELKDLELEEAPSVDDILRKALSTLLESYVKPALERQSEEGEDELPRQVLLTIPNTFTPAHVAVIRDLFRQEFGARRVVFLSESDAICWRYLTLVQDGHESLPQRFHDKTEYVLIVDIGAGTTDLTYVALRRRGWQDLERATILHRDGFRVAGNNVDTCLGRIVHHKLASLKGIQDSPYLYDAQQQIFPSGPDSGERGGEQRLEERFLYPIVLGLRDLKADLAKNRHDTLRLRISNDIPLFTEQRSAARRGQIYEWVRSWLRIGVGEGQRSTDIRLEPDEVLHAPAYSKLIHRRMSTDILRHFFAGCPLQWDDAPEGWCRDGRFPVDTMVVTGRGGLTPGLRPVLESALAEFRLDADEPVRQPDFSRHGKPEDLKLAVIEGVRDYIERFGAQAGLSNGELVRDRGIYEDYYLYTGPGRSYAGYWKLLDRDDHVVETVGEDVAGEPTLLRFRSPRRPMIPFMDANGSVMVVATSSRTPPRNPEKPDTYIRPFCQFSQKNLNREVEISFHVDTNRDFELRVDSQNIKGRENRIKTDYFEGLPGVLENMWPGRPCEPGEAADFFSPVLPVAGLPEEPEPESEPEPAPESEPKSVQEAPVVSEPAAAAEATMENPPEVPVVVPDPPVPVPDPPTPVPDSPAPAKPAGPKIAFADFDD